MALPSTANGLPWLCIASLILLIVPCSRLAVLGERSWCSTALHKMARVPTTVYSRQADYCRQYLVEKSPKGLPCGWCPNETRSRWCLGHSWSPCILYYCSPQTFIRIQHFLKFAITTTFVHIVLKISVWISELGSNISRYTASQQSIYRGWVWVGGLVFKGSVTWFYLWVWNALNRNNHVTFKHHWVHHWSLGWTARKY